MGWLRKSDDSDHISSYSGDVGEFYGSSNDGNSDRCATRKVVRSQCCTEEVEPGKFIRKCEKTEQIFKDCVGRPTQMVQSNKEYTEEDVTDQMVKGSVPFESEQVPSYFPGLRSGIKAIERDFFGGINLFFEAAENMKNEFFKSFGVPETFDKDSSSSHRHGIHIARVPPEESIPERNFDGDVDLSGLARDV